MDRNFYGTIKIGRYLDDWDEPYRLLLNGRITHGYQYENQYASDWITTYYTYGSGIELAIRLTPDKAKRVGVVGLGVGTIAGYAQKGDFYCMYDINPAVVNLSLSSCFHSAWPGQQAPILFLVLFSEAVRRSRSKENLPPTKSYYKLRPTSWVGC